MARIVLFLAVLPSLFRRWSVWIYYIERLPTNPWIHQPFEDYDSIRPHQLQAWARKGLG